MAPSVAKYKTIRVTAPCIPIDRRQGLKFGFASGLSTSFEANYDTFPAGYQFMKGGG